LQFCLESQRENMGDTPFGVCWTQSSKAPDSQEIRTVSSVTWLDTPEGGCPGIR